jgi:hypothetical protein
MMIIFDEDLDKKFCLLLWFLIFLQITVKYRMKFLWMKSTFYKRKTRLRAKLQWYNLILLLQFSATMRWTNEAISALRGNNDCSYIRARIPRVPEPWPRQTTLSETISEVETRSKFAIARNVARNVASCVRTLTVVMSRMTTCEYVYPRYQSATSYWEYWPLVSKE